MTKLVFGLLIICFTCCFIEARDEPTKKCPKNSSLRQCPQLCEPTCDDQTIRYCTPADKNGCPIGCRCDKDFYRNSKGNCVTKEECQKCGS